ncbi:hypothetical protein J9317_08200 [Metabacillus sp. KIGAM252]|uniref:VOC domain-containing protein n=1 Tax=Metabacillus flavus TaxID=2823519 RepID=A0ABS5LDP0_9BACI|nr:hypothetical protein [Metabacillus flavus]MBS2968736.1 hypothetical protein [Metabacillus flavus]
MLFHYHYWTPYLEETERFYTKLGFTVHQRIGRLNGSFQSFNPPLAWEDFRENTPLFRIIEMKKGKINVTVGYGKKVIFDHIGFFVSKEEHRMVCGKARNLGWKVEEDERRTFLSTPYGFRIELQTHLDVLASGDAAIEEMVICVSKEGLEKDINHLFNKDVPVFSVMDEESKLHQVVLNGIGNGMDPNGVRLSDTKKESVN